jgi:phosphomannomutase/phosphoglucomutase
MTRPRRALTKVWLDHKFTILAALAALLLVGGAAYMFNVVADTRRSSAVEGLQATAQAAAAAASGALSQQIRSVDELLDLPLLARHAASGDDATVIGLGEALRQRDDAVLGMRLLSASSKAPDYEARPPITFASLEMLKSARESGKNPPPEVLLSGQDGAHVAVLRRLPDGAGGIAGYVLLGLSPASLAASVSEVELNDGELLQLTQRDARGRAAVASIGVEAALDGGVPVSQPVAGTRLRAMVWSTAVKNVDANGGVPVLPSALGAAVLTLAVSLGVQGVRRRGGAAAERAPASVADSSTDEHDIPLHHNQPMPVAEVEEEAQPDAIAGGGVPALSESIFRAYDVRGVVEETLTEDVVRHLGLAIGSEAYQRGQQTLAVGGDGRLSTPSLVAALIEGIRASGRDVIDVGRVPTPVLYYATHFLETGSGVMVTGSHNPPNYNGFKMMLAGDTLFGDDIQALKQRILDQEYTSGAGNLQSMDIAADYIRRISEDVPVALGNAFKVVVDCGNGIAGDFAPKLVRALGHDVVELYCDVDGNFPNHHPDPSDPDNMQDLIAAVREQGADLGFAFDGDGDRLGIVDGNGEIVWPDAQMMLFARDVLSRNAGAEIVFDVKCSSRLAQAISKLGGKPVMYKTGHSFMKNKLKETGAPLAGEMSGHIFFKERWYGFDDALYSAARMLEILMAMDMPPAQVFSRLPRGASTPELKIGMQEGESMPFMDALSEYAGFVDGEVTTIDGIRVDWPDGWGLVRASNTTPSLVLRFEGDDEAALSRVQEVFRKAILSQRDDLELPF